MIDGSGAPRRITDVGIIGGRIATVGDLASRRAKIEIDATGLFVAPGFINIHSHATIQGLVRAENMLTQGVTTEIVNATGTVPVVTHMKAQGRENGRAADIIALMNGERVAAVGDIYPYLAGMTELRAFFIPGWAQEGGRTEMLKRFADADLRRRIAAEADELIEGRIAGGMDGIRLIEKGRRLADVARDLGVGPGEAVIHVLEESDTWMIADFGIEQDLETFLRAPQIAISCDCGATTETRIHPRSYGTFPRVLGRYVRERGVLTSSSMAR